MKLSFGPKPVDIHAGNYTITGGRFGLVSCSTISLHSYRWVIRPRSSAMNTDLHTYDWDSNLAPTYPETRVLTIRILVNCFDLTTREMAKHAISFIVTVKWFCWSVTVFWEYLVFAHSSKKISYAVGFYDNLLYYITTTLVSKQRY